MTLASMCMVAMPLLGSEFIKMLIQGDSFQSASKVSAQGSRGVAGGQAIDTRALEGTRRWSGDWKKWWSPSRRPRETLQKL
jgi:hypothetical protein